MVRALQSPSPLDIAMCQKRNNGLCGMMVQANYKIMKEKRTILLAGRDCSLWQSWQSSVWRFTKPPMPSGIAMCQKRNNSLCGMRIRAKYKNERRITVFLLSGSFLSSQHSLTSRLVRALQSPSPSDIVTKIDTNQSGSGMVQGKYKVEDEKRNDFLTFGHWVGSETE